MTVRALYRFSLPQTPPEHGSLFAWPARVIDWIAATHERARQRVVLAGLEDHRLRDIGVTRAEALAEARRPFWE